MKLVLIAVQLLVVGSLYAAGSEQYWAVHLMNGGVEQATAMANKHGLQLLGEVSELLQ